MSIPTTYRGIEYRSRLEAKWAAFFDAIGWRHTYEPFDGDGYIPDFLIHGDRPLLVEIKPADRVDKYRAPIAKVANGVRQHWDSDVIIFGVDPFPTFDDGAWLNLHYPTAGLLLGDAWIDSFFEPSQARWMNCGECDQISIFSSTDWYAGRPCGHYEGDSLMNPVDIVTLRGAWATATNDAKWRGRDAS